MSKKSRILILKYRKGELNTENEKLVIEFVKQYYHKQTNKITCKTKYQEKYYVKEKLASVDELLNIIIPWYVISTLIIQDRT